MNVSSTTSTSLTDAIQPGNDVRAKLQTMLLRKSLEAQQEQSAEIQRLADGKGQHIDLRV